MNVDKDSRSVFVVHGRNDDLRNAMFDFLRSINLNPMEWSRAVELTGEAAPYIGTVLEAAFDHATAVVVLMTPDEIAYLQPRYASEGDDPQTRPEAQARPNVLFEAGMALGRDAKRTVLVELGTVRPFSDVAGRHAVRLSNSGASRQELANRLKTAGCAVDLAGVDWHTKGDFSAPAPPGDGLPLGRRVPSESQSRPSVDFDVKYVNKGGNRTDKLQVINRGVEAAYDVNVAVPADAALDMRQARLPITKIPPGRSVTIDAINFSRMSFGSSEELEAFDVVVTGRTDGGESVRQEVFIDLNG